MYAVLKLVEINKYIVVATTWVRNFDAVRLINSGIKYGKEFVVFYSYDKNKEPIFHGHVSPLSDFEKNLSQRIDACYLATIDRIYGKIVQYFSYQM